MFFASFLSFCSLYMNNILNTFSKLSLFICLQLLFKPICIYSDDQRGFTFPSFDKAPKSQQPSESQLTCMSNLVSSYAINEDLFRPELTYNPLQQRLRKAIMLRVIDQDATLPDIDPRVKAYMEPDIQIIQKALPQLNEFQQLFKFVNVDNGKNGKKRKHFWSDITDDVKDENGNDKNGGEGSGEGEGGGVSTLTGGSTSSNKKKSVVIGSINPIQDFESYMKEPLLIQTSFEIFSERIESLIKDGATFAYYDKAVKCLICMKKYALLQSESEFYNQFMLLKIKNQFGPLSSSQHGEVWDLIIENNLTLISNKEDETVSITDKEAILFLSDDDSHDKQIKVEVVAPVKEGLCSPSPSLSIICFFCSRSLCLHIILLFTCVAITYIIVF